MRTKTTSVFFSLVCQGRALEKKKKYAWNFSKKKSRFFLKKYQIQNFYPEFFFQQNIFFETKIFENPEFFCFKKNIFFETSTKKKSIFFLESDIFSLFLFFFFTLLWFVHFFHFFFTLFIFLKQQKIENPEFLSRFFFSQFFFWNFSGSSSIQKSRISRFQKKRFWINCFTHIFNFFKGSSPLFVTDCRGVPSLGY